MYKKCMSVAIGGQFGSAYYLAVVVHAVGIAVGVRSGNGAQIGDK